MRSRSHAVRDLVCKRSVQPSRVQHDHMIEALAPDRADDSLHVGVLPRRSRRRSYLMDVYPFEGGRDMRKDRIGLSVNPRLRPTKLRADDPVRSTLLGGLLLRQLESLNSRVKDRLTRWPELLGRGLQEDKATVRVGDATRDVGGRHESKNWRCSTCSVAKMTAQ